MGFLASFCHGFLGSFCIGFLAGFWQVFAYRSATGY